MLRKLLHKILYVIILGLSHLPLRVLYFFASASYVLLYYILKYRRNVVSGNLKLAFPEMNEQQLKRAGQTFYMDFCEHFFETIKLLTMSKEQLHSMFDADYSVAEKLNKEGKSCYLLLGHQFNWELINAHMTSIYTTPTIIAYLPVPDPFFESLLLKIRTRFGSILTPSDKVARALLPYRNKTYNLALMADQNPASLERAFWIPFFGPEVPFFKGPERGARTGNNPVVFVDMNKVGRGKYKVHSYLLAEESKLTQESEITRLYAAKLEESIRRSPGNYLWSHRRWRYNKEDYS